MADVSRLRPAPLRIDDSALDDLRARLRSTRWPYAPAGVGWSLGTDTDYLRELVGYWVEEFDWRRQEESLNRLDRFVLPIDDLDIHLVHVRAQGGRPGLPLLLCHGWPDSSWRYSKVVPLLTDPGAHGADPADAFDVIVPDMPGYGWSSPPTGAVPDATVVAGLWARLMEELGYEHYGAAGGDIGSAVSRYLALAHPDRVVAVHRMDAGIPVFTGDPSELTAEEQEFLRTAAAWAAQEGAYAAMHRTRPQTVAAALSDSPAGLAAWIVEKLRAWSDCDGDVERRFSKDEMLTNVTAYWLSNTIGSSMRMYAANGAIPPQQHLRRVQVPSGFTFFPADLLRPPQAWLDRTATVVRVVDAPAGGHFAPFEEPELYAQELRDFFRPYRSGGSSAGPHGAEADR